MLKKRWADLSHGRWSGSVQSKMPGRGAEGQDYQHYGTSLEANCRERVRCHGRTQRVSSNAAPTTGSSLGGDESGRRLLECQRADGIPLGG